jgi:hypothetical protein
MIGELGTKSETSFYGVTRTAEETISKRVIAAIDLDATPLGYVIEVTNVRLIGIGGSACLQFSRPQTSSINCSPIARLSVPRFPRGDSVPPVDTLGASLLLSCMKANISWFFCRLSLISCAAYLPFPLTPCGDRSGLQHLRAYYALC